MNKYTFNESYFEEINSEDKSYFLGLLYADGYNSYKRYFTLQLQEKDKEILEEFQKFLNSNYPIQLYERSKINKLHSNMYRLQVNGRKISEDLFNLGCFQNKSKILKFPSINQVPHNLINHFVRGYFDGDGSAWEGKRKLMDVKDSTRKEGHRIRIIHNVKFNMTGTEDMMLNIQKVLIEKLGFKENKINRSKNIGNCVQLEYSGRLQMKKFYDFIYDNSNVYFKRKKKKFEDIFNCANIQ